MPRAVFSQPTPALPAVQDPDRVDDDHDFERAQHEHLPTDQADDELQPAIGSDRPEPGQQLREERVVTGGLGGFVRPESKHEEPRP